VTRFGASLISRYKLQLIFLEVFYAKTLSPYNENLYLHLIIVDVVSAGLSLDNDHSLFSPKHLVGNRWAQVVCSIDFKTK